MPEDTLKLRDIPSPEPYLLGPGLAWWMWLLIAFGVFLLVLAIYTLVSIPKRQKRMDPAQARDAAYRKAEQVIQRAAELPNQEAATHVSAAIRGYLTEVCGDPSLFETHEEYLARHEALQQFPKEIREQVSELFSKLASMKYDRPEFVATQKLASEQPLSVLRQLHQQAAA